MIIYRPHRGALIDSMREAREFETLDEMKDYIIKDDIFPIKKEDIILSKETHDDNRINWKDVHYVCVGKSGCIGMCSKNYKFQKLGAQYA